MKKLIFTAVIAILTSSAQAETCQVGQGPDEWLPGVVTTTLPTSGSAGTPRVQTGRKVIAMWLPAAAAGDCYGTFDPATLDSTGKRGFPVTRGGDKQVVNMGSVNSTSQLRVVCTAQLVTPNGMKVFQCK